MKRGFTLVELVIVIVIIGILASIALTQYGKIVERARASEARAMLGQIRHAQIAYKTENAGVYTDDIGKLDVVAPAACNATYYFSYSLDATKATAARCSADGKTPDVVAGSIYSIDLGYNNGSFTSTPAGY